MTFEGLLKQELSTISALNDNIYPLSVPENVVPPYISYALAGGEYLNCLDGQWPMQLDYEVNILAERYAGCKTIEKRVNEVIKGLKLKECEEGIVKEVNLEIPTYKYEEAVNLQRGNVKFSVYF